MKNGWINSGDGIFCPPEQAGAVRHYRAMLGLGDIAEVAVLFVFWLFVMPTCAFLIVSAAVGLARLIGW